MSDFNNSGSFTKVFAAAVRVFAEGAMPYAIQVQEPRAMAEVNALNDAGKAADAIKQKLKDTDEAIKGLSWGSSSTARSTLEAKKRELEDSPYLSSPRELATRILKNYHPLWGSAGKGAAYAAEAAWVLSLQVVQTPPTGAEKESFQQSQDATVAKFVEGTLGLQPRSQEWEVVKRYINDSIDYRLGDARMLARVATQRANTKKPLHLQDRDAVSEWGGFNNIER